MAEGFEPIESQEALDAILRERLGRERKKFADYDELKAKAAKLDEMEAASKTDLEKAQQRIAELEKAAKDREEADRVRGIREKVAKATGVPAELIVGSDEDQMTEFAKSVAAYAKKPSAPALNESGKFAAKAKPGGKDEAMREFAASLFGEASE